MFCRPLIAHARLDHLCTLLPLSPYYPTATSSSHTLRAFALFSLAINLPSLFHPIRPFLSPTQLLFFFFPLFSFFSLSFLFSPLFSSSHPYFYLRRSRSLASIYSSPFLLPSSLRDTRWRRYRLTRRFFTVPWLAISVYPTQTLFVSSVVLDRLSRSIAATFSRSVSICSWWARHGSTTENLETRSSTAWLRRWPSVVRRNPVLIKARLDARRRPGRERRRLSLSLSLPLFPFILTAVHRVSICPNLSLHLRPTHSIGVFISLRRLLPAFPHSAQLDPAAPRHAARPLPVLVAPRYDRARTKEKIKKTSEPAPSVHCAAYTRRGEPVVPACNGTRAADDDSMPLLFPFFLLSSAAASLSPSSP